MKSIIQSAFEFARDRARLIKLEAHSAGSSLRKIGYFTLAGIIAFTCGYSLLVWLGVRLASSRWFNGQIEPALAIISGIHIFAGGLCLLAARVRSRRTRFFRNSLAEITRDRKWLQGIKDKLKDKP
ncbi:MAG: phage holin family protein [Verrucomicrobiales bacterium]